MAPVTSAMLERANELRTTRLPPDLKAFYRAVGVGCFGWFEIIDPGDRYRVDDQFRFDLSSHREDSQFDEVSTEGDPPDLNSLVVGIADLTCWIYDVDPARSGRIVTYAIGAAGRRKAWTAAASLLDFVRCITELAETGLFIGNPTTHDTAPYMYVESWDPDLVRDLLDRNHATGAIYWDPSTD